MDDSEICSKFEFWKYLLSYTAPLWLYSVVLAISGAMELFFSFHKFIFIGVGLLFNLPLLLLCFLIFNKWARNRSFSLFVTWFLGYFFFFYLQSGLHHVAISRAFSYVKHPSNEDSSIRSLMINSK